MTQKAQGQIDATGRWVLIATISASSMAFIMQSALNLALPSIQRELGATGADLLWIVNIYQLLLGALILVGGSLGDHYGRKRVYMVGIAVFVVMSAVCGLAPTTDILILSRAVMGIGGALMIPGSLAIVSAYFDDNTRGRAIGTWSAFTTMTSVLGPVLGGILAEAGLWRMIFFINVPLAILSLFALLRFVPESRDEAAPRQLDILGALLITLGMGGIVYGATEIGRVGIETGLRDPLLVGAFVGGVIAVIAFVVVEARSDHPMMPLKLFKSATFSGANLLTFFLYGALGGALFFLPLNLIQVQGYGETVAGLALLPFSILLIVMSPRMGKVVDQYGPRVPLVVGPIVVGVAFLAFALPGITDGPGAYWTSYLPGAVLFGVGMGLVVAPLTTSVMGSVPQQNSGTASGVNNAVSRSAGTIMTAIMGGIALIFFTSSLTADLGALSLPDEPYETILANAGDLAAVPIPDSLSETQAAAAQQAVDGSFVETFRLMMLIGAGLSFLSSGLAFITIRSELKPPPELLDQAA